MKTLQDTEFWGATLKDKFIPSVREVLQRFEETFGQPATILIFGSRLHLEALEYRHKLEGIRLYWLPQSDSSNIYLSYNESGPEYWNAISIDSDHVQESIATVDPVIIHTAILEDTDSVVGGRPRTRINCPSCGALTPPENLGHWYGWRFGKEPPYWQGLRVYVLRRDGYKCMRCGTVLSLSTATIHHIIPKESGGTDSARNLTSLCSDCHKRTQL